MRDSQLIRPARLDDIPAISAIYARAVTQGTASFELTPPGETEMARRMSNLIEGRFPYLTVEASGEVIGYAYAGPYRPRPAYRHTVEDSVYLAHSAQGRGIGRQLLGMLITECEARGFRQMIAVIGDRSSLASIRLHAALGFREAGVLSAVGFKHGRWLDSILMQRALGEGDLTPAGK